MTTRMRATQAATLPLPEIGSWPGEDGHGRDDYAGEFVDRIALEEFSKGALLAIIDELCLQEHLLSTSFMVAVEQRFGTEAAVEVGRHQFTGISGVTSDRFRRALGLGREVADVAQVLELHPALRPRSYVDARIALDGDRLTVSLHDSPALREQGLESWIGLLADGHDVALDAMVHAVDPRARFQVVDPLDGARATWEVVIGPEPLREQPEVEVTRFSTGADFTFEAPSEVHVELGSRPS